MKKLLIAIGLIILLVIVALIAIPMFIDPNDYKDQIVEQVKKHTGRDLTITGDLKMSKFPSIGVDIGEISFGNAPGFGDQPMLKSGQASVSVKLLPLLKKDLQVSTLTLKDVFIYLAKDKAGKTNWDDLSSGGEEKSDQSSDAPKLAALAIGGIDMENANLIWDDQSTGKKYSISNLNLKTGTLELNKPIDLNMSFDMDAAAEGIAGNLTLDGTVEYDLDGNKYSVKPLEFIAQLKGTGIPGGETEITLKASSAHVNLNTGTASIAGLDLDALGTTISGDIDATNIFEKIPLLDGQIKINADDIPALLTALGQDASTIPLKSLTADTKLTSSADSMKIDNLTAKAVLSGDQIPNSPVYVVFNMTADVNLAKETLNVQNFSIEGMGLNVQGAATGTQIVKNPNINGNVKITPFNLREFMSQINMEAPVTTDPNVLSNFGFNSQFNATKNSVSLKGMGIKLDDTNITGDLSLVNFSNPTPTFNVNIDSINVDRYMAPTVEGEEVAASETEATSGDLPMDSLRKLKAKGTLNIGNLIISNAKLQNIKLGLDAKGGKIKLSPLKADLYKGSYNGAINLNATGSQPAVNVSSALNGVQVAPLLTDLTGSSKIDGTLIGKININAVGADADAIKKTLNGTTDLTFSNGALLGVNIAKIIREAKAKLTGKSLPPSDEPVKTDFSELSASTVIKNGLVTNPDFLMKSPFLRITGKGSANLVSEAIDYKVTTTIVGSGAGQGGEDLADLQGIDIPIKVSGTFSNMKYRPDLGGVMKAKVDKELDKQKDKIKGKAAKKLDKLIPGLGGLLGDKKDKAAEGDTSTEEKAESKKPEDLLKGKLKGLFN